MTKISVSFTQKVSEQPYETADYSLTIEQDVPDGSDPVAIGSSDRCTFSPPDRRTELAADDHATVRVEPVPQRRDLYQRRRH